MSKCYYCNKENALNEMIINTWNGTVRKDMAFSYCSEECKKEIESHSNNLNKGIKYFFIFLLLAVISFILLSIISMILKEKKLILVALGTSISFLGMILIIYPFSTPETIQKWGLRRSIKILKDIGFVLSITGIGCLIICAVLILC